MIEHVVLVNERDEETGTAEKMAAHREGLLHRAFSVFLFDRENPTRMLMQQRAAGKYHCPLLWANACCSHPRKGETPVAGARRRLQEELGLDVPGLVPAGTFIYKASVGALTEYEMDHVFSGLVSAANIPFNSAEVNAVDWVDIAQPQAFAGKDIVPWLEEALAKALSADLSPHHTEALQKITQQKKRAAA